MPAATAAADPPLDPPGMRPRSQGLRVISKPEFSVEEPIANSSMLSLPTITAPSALSRATTVASYGGTKPARIREPQVVGTPGRAQHVLERDRDPGQRPTAPGGDRAVGGVRLPQRVLGRDGEEGVDPRLHGRDAVQHGPGQLAGADLPFGQAPVRLFDGQFMQVHGGP